MIQRNGREPKDGPDYVSVEDGALFRLCKQGEILPGTASKTKAAKYLLAAQLRDLEQVFRDYPEAKSLAPDGSPCRAATHGLLRRRPIHGLAPFRLMGKEIDRSIQDDFAVFSDSKPLEYGPQPLDQANVRLSTHGAITEMLKQRIQAISIKELARQTGVDRNTIRRVLRGERVHSKTRAKLLKAVANIGVL
jgi:hypothetical protein